MVTHKFFTAKLAANLVAGSTGGFWGVLLRALLPPIINLLENSGLRLVNVQAVNFTTAQDREAFDKAQSVSLDATYVASLTKEQRIAGSKDFRSKFKKFVTFGFVKPKSK